MKDENRKAKKGFSLGEILIILTVMGIIMIAITPTLQSNIRWHRYRTGVRKAKAILDKAIIRYGEENGTNIACGYWLKSPYNFKPQCATYDANGNCLQWVRSDNGEDLPYDYSGFFEDCPYVYDFFLRSMNVIEKCDKNAHRNHCIPEYEGVDTIIASKNSDDSYTSNRGTSTLPGLRKQSILSGKAFLTADDFLFMPYGNFNAPIMIVDVNGRVGPNKWGHDVHVFIAKTKAINATPTFYPYIESYDYVEKGGKTTYELLYKKLNNSTM